MAALASDQAARADQPYADMAPQNLLPLWESLHDLVLPKPKSPARPYSWRYGEVRGYLMRAGGAPTVPFPLRRQAAQAAIDPHLGLDREEEL